MNGIINKLNYEKNTTVVEQFHDILIIQDYDAQSSIKFKM
jgi:hypothetical protein